MAPPDDDGIASHTGPPLFPWTEEPSSPVCFPPRADRRKSLRLPRSWDGRAVSGTAIRPDHPGASISAAPVPVDGRVALLCSPERAARRLQFGRPVPGTEEALGAATWATTRLASTLAAPFPGRKSGGGGAGADGVEPASPGAPVPGTEEEMPCSIGFAPTVALQFGRPVPGTEEATALRT